MDIRAIRERLADDTSWQVRFEAMKDLLALDVGKDDDLRREVLAIASDRLANDGDDDVRATAVDILVERGQWSDDLLRTLLHTLNDPHPKVVERALTRIGQGPPQVLAARIEDLFDVIGGAELRPAMSLVDHLVAIDQADRLADLADAGIVAGEPSLQVAAGRVTLRLPANHPRAGRLSEQLLEAIVAAGDGAHAARLADLYLAGGPSLVDGARVLLDTAGLPSHRRAAFLFLHGMHPTLQVLANEDPSRIVRLVANGVVETAVPFTLPSGTDSAVVLGLEAEPDGQFVGAYLWEGALWPYVGADWLAANIDDIVSLAEDVRGDLVPALVRGAADYGTPIVGLFALVGVDEALAVLDHQRNRNDVRIGEALLALTADDRYANDIAAATTEVLRYAVAALKGSDNWLRRKEAAEWITYRLSSLTASSYPNIQQALEEQLKADTDDDVKHQIKRALSELEVLGRQLKTQPLIEDLRGDDEEKALRAIDSLCELGTPDAHRSLVQEWIGWIAVHLRGVRTEYAAEKLRRQPDAVLPLLDALEQEVDWDLHRAELITAVAPRGTQDIVERIFLGEPIEDAQRLQVERVAERVAGARSRGRGPGSGTPDRHMAEEVVRDALDEVRQERQRVVDRRIARQLAEMSESRFFREDDATFERVRTQLRNFAVPVLGRRLIGEEDLETRESVARALGNLGSREAVDALTRAIVGEERTQTRRQALLESYYLDPAKRRSDAADTILEDAVREARRTLLILQAANVALFVAGLGLLVTGVLLIFFGDRDRADFVAPLLLGGGLGTLLLQQIRRPLVRIQHAMNKLVQLETAFTSFMWELNLNQTYIQSQYVARGVLDHHEVAGTIDRIERSVRLAMELVSRYGDELPGRLSPQLLRVYPSAGAPGDTIRLKGAWLSGSNGHGERMVAINHVPLKSVRVRSSGDDLEITLDDSVAGAGAGPVWLSVYVDGEETNALPFHLDRGGGGSITIPDELGADVAPTGRVENP